MLAVQPLIAVSFSLLFVGQSRLLAAAVPPDRQASAQTLGSALSNGVGGLLAGVGRVAASPTPSATGLFRAAWPPPHSAAPSSADSRGCGATGRSAPARGPVRRPTPTPGRPACPVDG